VATITIGGTADVTMARFPALRGDSAVTTITFDGGTFRPYASSLTYMTNLTHAYLTANGANINVASGIDITIDQVLEDAPTKTGVLTKAGAGALTLSGANTYTGNTTVSDGTLEGAVASSIKGNVNVSAGVLKLSHTSAMDTAAALTLPASPSGNVNLNFSGTQMLGALVFGSTPQAAGTWGSLTSGAYHKNAAFTGNGLLQIGANNTPVAQNITLPSVQCGASARLEIIGGKSPPSDADSGDTLTVYSVQNPTANGGTAIITESGATILYTAPASGSSDTFTYTVTDGKSVSAPATVTVTSLTPGGGASPNVVAGPTYDSGTGKFSVTFAGIPNLEYTVEYAEGAPAPPWLKLKNITAGTNGLFLVEDTASQSPSRYYRTVYPSY